MGDHAGVTNPLTRLSAPHLDPAPSNKLARRSPRSLARLDALDLRLFRAAATNHSPVLDRVLPPLTSSADHGLLWFAVTGVLALTGERRAAVRGLASLGVASAVANIPIKLAARRSRPQLHIVPTPRQLFRQPTTSSFPSGHSASAAAFAIGVAMEAPIAAAPSGRTGRGRRPRAA